MASEGEVWVVAIRYFCRSKRGEPGVEQRTDAAAYIGQMSLMESLRAIHRAEPVIAEVRFVEAIDCCGKSRREVALQAETAVRAVVRSED